MLAWTLAEDAVPRLLGRLDKDKITVSRHTVAALRDTVEVGL
jgi:hypothetical protein